MLFYKNYIDNIYSDYLGMFIEKYMQTRFHHDW